MAQGDVHVFDAFLENVFDSGIHDFGASPNAVKCALITAVQTPATTSATPRWGAGGGTNFATDEVTSGGNYAAGGAACAVASASLVGGVLHIDFGDPATWAVDPGNPTNARWGIIYDATTANKECIAYVDLGSAFDMATGDLTITWGAPFATVNQA